MISDSNHQDVPENMHHHHSHSLVILSVIIAIFASYTALDLVNSISSSKGRIKWVWLIGGSLAMGVGIWSMHFIGMLAFRIPGIDIYYDVPLLFVSILVAVCASALALFLVTHRKPSFITYSSGSVLMGAAIAGMHYIGIASMRMGATIQWDYSLVVLSVIVAIAASWAALLFAFKLSEDISLKGFLYRGIGGVLMGAAISGMHYTAMAAMSFTLDDNLVWSDQQLLATDGLAAAIIIGTLVILGIALSGSNVDRALSRKTLMNDILQEGIRARDQFLSIASHELKTPLTSLKLHTELVIRHLSKDEFDKKQLIGMLQKTDDNLNRINHLVDDMLDISRITAGKLKLNKTTADLKDVLQEVVDRFRPQFAHSKLGELNLEGESVIGSFDVFRIEQVASNLITNAMKYGRGGNVEVKLESRNGHAIFCVKDHGMGIPKEFQQRIFERFERAISANEISGLGLGLFIVKEIIEIHGGRIWVESEEDQGSIFYVDLPLS